VVDRTTTATPSFSFQIADTGIGISPDQVANLFQAFIQADVSTTRKYGGTGLGLAITQRFCQMMGGDVSVVSELGQGSTFTMVLPATVTDPKLNLALPIPAQVQPLTAETSLVLIIDNDPLVHDLMRRSLNKEGFQVESAFNGSEGLYKAKALQPDVIILDVMLPEMDGWTVLATLKTDPDLQNIPVIMASILDNKKLGYTMGATDFLTKPIDRQRLSTLLKRYCSGTASRSILLVEDDPTSRKLMRYLLEQEGCQVAEAENGQIALNWLTEIKPELILLDLVMPELDGFGVIEALQANPEWRMIPIVVITSKTLSAIEQQQLQGCVEKIVQKGAFSREELLTEVQRLVTNFVERSTAIAQSPALNSVPQT
jgi:CheY-like chemotaxis protein